MSLRSEPFESKDLRDCATPGAVARVWSRLEEETIAVRPTPRPPTNLIWGLAAASVAFAAGVWVGEGSNSHQDPVAMTPVSAEPPLGAEPASVQAPIVPPAATVRAVAERWARSPTPPRDNKGRALAPRPIAAVSAPEAVLAAPTAPIAPASPPLIERETPPEWQLLASRGDYEDALFVLGQEGGFESALASASAEQLMLLVDLARATGQRQRALAALRRIVKEFPGEPVAPLAAWSLGNLLEKVGDAQGAEEAFSAYRALSPEGDFAEDALVRQLQRAVNQSDSDRAVRLLAQYESEFLEGRRADEVSRLRERLLNADSRGADAGAEQLGGGDSPGEPYESLSPTPEE